MKSRRRGGFSLLEVIIATAILLSSVIVLMELASIGGQHATSAEEMAIAQRLCQSKLNEILAGASPVAAVDDELLPDLPGWICSVEIESIARPGMRQGLAALRVTVSEDVDGNQLAEDELGKQYTLTRWIRDPLGQSDTSFGPFDPRDASRGPFGRDDTGGGLFDPGDMDVGPSLPPAMSPRPDPGGDEP